MAEKSVIAKVIIQQCLEASLKVAEETSSHPAKFLKIGRGIVVYVCFMKDASLDTVEKMITTVTQVRLSKTEEDKLVSVIDLPGSILIVPQATIGGKLKGKRMQYHGNINKADGLNLYKTFVEKCRSALQEHNEGKVVVESGIYGNLQVLSICTNGPYTHTIEFT